MTAACNLGNSHLFAPLEPLELKRWGGQPLAHPRIREARQVCQGCPRRLPCLTAAIESDTEIGVWGGEYFSRELRRHRPKGRAA